MGGSAKRIIARTISCAVVAAVVLSLPAPAAADPGDLDPSFDGDGIATTSVGRAGGFPSAVAVQADGKLVLAGGTGDAPALVRFESDGTLDPTFGDDGKVVTRFSDGAWAADVATVDGGLIVAGTVGLSEEKAEMLIARYRPNGALDPTFAADGITTIHFNEDAYAEEIALQPDGRIIVAGTLLYPSGDSRFPLARIALARLTPDGHLDPTFDDDGKVTTAVHGQSSYASSVVVSSRGILAVGSMAPHRAGRLAAVRYTFGGELDQAFSGDGVFVRSLSAERGAATGASSVAIDDEGRAVIGAFVFDPDYFTSVVAILRVRTGGSLDHSFADDGILVTSAIHEASAVEIQADGKIVVAGGTCCGGGEEWTYTVARFGRAGRPDPGFGDHGVAFADTPDHPDHTGPLTDATLQPDGRIVAVGVSEFTEGFLAVRLLA